MRRSSLLTVLAATAALSLTTVAATAAPAKKITLGDKLTATGHPVAGGNAVVKVAASVPAGDKVTKYTVNWGDHSKTVTGTKLPKSLSHKYTVPGTYSVVLTITDKNHKSVKTTRKVVIGAVNLLVNGNAETGAASDDSSTIFAPAGWTTTEEFTQIQYGDPEFPDATNSKAISGGKNFFGGGNSDVATATQTVSVASKATAIDAGKAIVALSADLGGFSSQDDSATVTATYLNAAGTALGSAIVGPVTELQRGGLTKLLPRATSAHLPAGTRTIQVVITATRTEGSYDDGYIDNVSLSVASS